MHQLATDLITSYWNSIRDLEQELGLKQVCQSTKQLQSLGPLIDYYDHLADLTCQTPEHLANLERIYKANEARYGKLPIVTSYNA